MKLNCLLMTDRKRIIGILFIFAPCKKAKKWLDEHGLVYEDRHIKEHKPTYEELKGWQEKSGLELKKFFNTSGLQYKALGLKDRLPTMSVEEQLQNAEKHQRKGIEQDVLEKRTMDHIHFIGFSQFITFI